MDPLLKPYSPQEQVRILAAVNRKCGLDGEQMTLLDDIEGDEASISKTLQMLTELKLIETATWERMSGTYYYPVRITLAGKNFLASGDKAFWEKAERIFVNFAEKWTGVNLGDFVDFAETVWKKVQFERDSQ